MKSYFYFTETIPEINECLTQIDNCFELLIPHPTRYNDTDVPSEAMESTASITHSTEQGDETICAKGLAKERTKVKSKGQSGNKTSRGKDCESDNEIENKDLPGESSKQDDGNKDLAGMKNSQEDDDDEDVDSEEEEGLTHSPVHAGKNDDLLQQHGLPSWHYNIDININTGKNLQF